MVVCCDIPNWFYTLWHASQGDRVTAEVLRRLKCVEETWHPERIIAAFDSHPSFRQVLDASYKANREQPPQGLLDDLEQLPWAIDELSTAKVAMVGGFEADDVLATVAHECSQRGVKCVLCTSDKDARQCLVKGFVTICRKFSLQDGKIVPTWVTYDGHLQEYGGVPPTAWAAWLALVGDSSDNVKGCEKVGEKTATALLAKHGSLAAILSNPDAVACGQVVRKNLRAFRERAELVLKLVTCRTDVPGVADFLREAAA